MPAGGRALPQDAESTQMSDEVIGTMVTSAMHTDLPSDPRVPRCSRVAPALEQPALTRRESTAT